MKTNCKRTGRIILNIIVKAWVWLLLSVFSISLQADTVPRIFDWTTYIDTNIAGVIPIPDPEYFAHDWRTLYDYQNANGGIIGLMLRNPTGPYDGTTPDALDTVMDYIDVNGYSMSYVFADFESATEDQNCLSMISQVRNHLNPAINSARIGNYGQHPGTTQYYDVWGSFDRMERHNFYINSGMDVAMPSLYPSSVQRNHNTRADIFGTNLCVSIPHALFWAPLERFSSVKREISAEHLLIPWISGFIYSSGYEAPVPSQAECRALLQHIRLRGTDGYYSLGHGNNTNYASRAEYRDDMYQNAWKPLDWFFKLPGSAQILNLTTNKTGGVEWSGMRRGNHCLFIFSNYTVNTAQVDLPEGIENLPDFSPVIASGEHLLFDYVVGPLAYWKLNENIGTAVVNQMSGSYSGTLTGAAWSSGKSGSALTFDGTDDQVSFGDVLDMGTGDRSISLWFKTTQTGTNKCLLSKGYSCTGNQHAIYLYNGNLLCLMDVSGTDRIVSSGQAVNDGNWHHAVITIDRHASMKLYLDGALKATTDISMEAAVNAQDAYGFYLGRTNIAGQYFQGSIDEVKIYSGVLSETDVLDEYAVSLKVKLDERQGTAINDDAIYAYNGTLSGATWSNGKSGSALTFDGTDDQVNFGDVLDMGTGDRSISLWFKTTQTGTNKCLLSKGYSCTGNQHAIYLYNGNLLCLMDVSGTDRIVNSGQAVNDGNWHHVAVTIDRDASIKLYLDGVLKATTDVSMEVAVNAQDSYSFYLGRSNIAGQYFQGALDDVKIYNKVLSANEVASLYNSY